MKKEKNDSNVWIGMLTVIPHKNNNDLGDAKGAVVNVLYYTNSKDNYIKEVNLKMNEFGFNVLEFEDVELFDFEANSKELIKKSELLNETNPFMWDKFYLTDELDIQE